MHTPRYSAPAAAVGRGSRVSWPSRVLTGSGAAARHTSFVRRSSRFQTRRSERQSSPDGFSDSSRGWSMAAGIWNQPAHPAV